MFHSGVIRCLDCDAEMTGPVCEGCELTPAAASLVVRRKVILRTGLFLLGSLAFLAAIYRFPPLEMDKMLVFCGVLFFAGLGIAVWVERGAVRGNQIAIRKRLFYTLIPVPWVLGGMLVLNAKLDNAPVRDWRAEVVGKFSMAAMVPTRRLVVVSRPPGRQFERVAVSEDEYSRFRVGEDVVVEIHPGLIGVPWVARVVPDPLAGPPANESPSTPYVRPAMRAAH